MKRSSSRSSLRSLSRSRSRCSRTTRCANRNCSRLLISSNPRATCDSATPLLEDVARSADRALAARGLLYLAQSQERHGKGDALATYQRVVSKFGGPQDVMATSAEVSIARAKLYATAQKGAGPSFQKVWDSKGAMAVSPDGRFMAFTDWNTGDLGVHDMASGKDRLVTTNGTWNDNFAEASVPSPDSRLLAYSWVNEAKNTSELRLIAVDGGAPRVLRRNDADVATWPVGWSADGRSVLVAIDKGAAQGPSTRDLAFIAINGGSVRVVKQFTFERGAVYQTHPRLSPDGRFIAYNVRPNPAKAERDVFVLSLDSGRDVAVVQNPADDDVLGWFPEGERILMASDRGGTTGIWAARVADGPGSEPVLVRPDTGAVASRGFTKRGDFYYGTTIRKSEVYVASIDAGSGTQVGRLAPLEGRFVGRKLQAAWSPNGDRIAYVQPPKDPAPGPVQNQQLVIQTMATGDVRVHQLALQNIQNPAWMPDGRALIAQGRDLDGRQGLHLVNAETGAVTTVAHRDPTNDIQRVSPAPSSDGRLVFFKWASPAAPAEGGIAVRDLNNSSEQRLSTQPSGTFALAPDGRSLALLTHSDNETCYYCYRISTASASGGRAAPLSPANEWAGVAAAYSNDGDFLFAVKYGPRGQEVWRVPMDGSQPHSTGISVSGTIERISAHPDGRRLALSTLDASSEIWVIQNLTALRPK